MFPRACICAIGHISCLFFCEREKSRAEQSECNMATSYLYKQAFTKQHSCHMSIIETFFSFSSSRTHAWHVSCPVVSQSLVKCHMATLVYTRGRAHTEREREEEKKRENNSEQRVEWWPAGPGGWVSKSQGKHNCHREKNRGLLLVYLCLSKEEKERERERGSVRGIAEG